MSEDSRSRSGGGSVHLPDIDESYDLLFKVVLIGDAGVGKTCAVQRFKHGVYIERHGNTIGVDFMLKTVEVEGTRIKIWDTAGQERFRTITQSYYRGAHGVIVTYDITKADSFSHIPQWMDDVKRYAGSNSLMLLMGTKVDIANSNKSRRQVTLEEAKSLASNKHMVGVVETSAKEDTNIGMIFLELAGKLKEKHERLTSMGESEKSIKLTTVQVQEEKKCAC